MVHISVQFKVLSVFYCILFILLYLCAHHFVYLSAQHQLSLLIYRTPTPTHSHLFSENTFHIHKFIPSLFCMYFQLRLKYVFIRKMLLFHIHYQCLFKDNQGLFCERSIYTHTLILVPFVLYSTSVDLSSSHSISKLHFIQCRKFYTHTHTHTQSFILQSSPYYSTLLIYTCLY
jgi:hypothetical protein